MSYWLQFTPWGPSHSETHDIVKSSKMVGIFDNKTRLFEHLLVAQDIVLTTPFISVSLMQQSHGGRYMVTDLPVGSPGVGNVKA